MEKKVKIGAVAWGLPGQPGPRAWMESSWSWEAMRRDIRWLRGKLWKGIWRIKRGTA